KSPSAGGRNWPSLIAEEAQEFLQDLLRLLFFQIMATVQRPSFHWRICVLPPDIEHVPELPHRTFRAPQRENRSLDFASGFLIGLRKFQILKSSIETEVFLGRIDGFTTWLPRSRGSRIT